MLPASFPLGHFPGVGGGQGWVGSSLSVPQGSQLGWWSGGLASCEGFGWGMYPAEQHHLGRQWGGLGGGRPWWGPRTMLLL